MKRTITLMILCMTVAVAAFAQQKPADQAAKPAEAMPTVDQILDKYVQALGGKAAIEIDYKHRINRYIRDPGIQRKRTR